MMFLMKFKPRQRLGRIFTARDVGAGTEGATCRCQHNNFDVVVLFRSLEGRIDLNPQRTAQRVELLRAIQGNNGYRVADFVEDEFSTISHQLLLIV